MQLATIIGIAILLFVSFSIGVNLALHGVLSVQQSISKGVHQISSEIVTEISTITGATSVDITQPVATSTPSSISVTSVSTNPSITKSEPQTMPPRVERPIVNNFLEKAMSSNDYKAVVEHARTQLEVGEITNYVKSGGLFPIVMLTCNRPQLLVKTIESLLHVRGVSPSNIVVLQDGAMQEVADIANSNKFKLIQNLKGLRMRGGAGVDGGAAIAQHYKFALSSAFDAFPDSPAIIIVEDDLLFSPDFYEYLHHTAPVLDTDKSVMLISAWNDNGFLGKVQDPFHLRRTEYFPGLGWLLPRKLYKNELEVKWPTEHWDHWLRSRATHKGREIIYPQVPRTYHNGIKGTFMTLDTHNKYFRDIAYNTNKDVKWDQSLGIASASSDPGYIQVMPQVYEARISYLINNCEHITSFQDLFVDKIGLYCVWIDVSIDGSGYGPPEFEPIASLFGIWHEHRRGGHKGLHEFYWDPSGVSSAVEKPVESNLPAPSKSSSYILLLNVKEDAMGGIENYLLKKPEHVRPFKFTDFSKRALLEARRRYSKVEGVPAPKPGMNCVQVCSEKGLACKVNLFAILNSCPALSEKFACQECITSIGSEQPAYVNPEADKQYFPGRCLVSNAIEQTTCESAHQATYRLCACA